MLVCIEDLNLEGPKASGGSQKIYAREMKLRDPHWSQEVMLMVKVKAPLMKAAAIPNNEVLSSSSDKNSLIRIRKTSHSELLLENQQAMNFFPSSLFMAIGNNLQEDPPCPDHAAPVQVDH
ncbi:hypothetical protein H920_08834 [Fukomys damarensis]|uniref:Uncharacterized protein n=1 Tax=Fukomys damarensis TaxID=885580 RepID=A0A091DC36_FUKDA|nr:hypothetical protein H920_08834 [Fukomys damarensis]